MTTMAITPPPTGALRIALISSVVMLLGITASFLVTSNVALAIMTQAIFYALLALGVGVLLRQNGMVSFGHAVFFGLPAYLIGMGFRHTSLPAEVLIVASIVIITVFALVIGLVFVRVHGIAFGMLTLAVGQAFYEAAGRFRELTGGFDGMTVRWPRQLFGVPTSAFERAPSMFAISWCVLIVTLSLIVLLSKSRFGALTVAIRENESRAAFLGYKTLLPRAIIFALSALIAAIGGVLFSIYNGFVSPSTVHWTASGEALVMAILGGATAPWGSVLGAFVYFFFKELLGSFTTHWMSIVGSCLIVVSVAFPEGMAGLVNRLMTRRVPNANP